MKPIKTTFPAIRCIESDEAAARRELSKAESIKHKKCNEAENRARRMFNKGKTDRENGLPCRSTDGRYLDGWYSK